MWKSDRYEQSHLGPIPLDRDGDNAKIDRVGRWHIDVMTDATPPFLRTPFDETLARLAEHGEPPDERSDIDTASLKRRFSRLARVETRELSIPAPDGPQPARLYRDLSAAPSGEALVWVHGGAFIQGTLDMPEANWVSLELAAAGTPVLSIEYTKCLGKTHFRTPVADVRAAWEYAAEDAENLFAVPRGHVALGGASAGGALAGGVTVCLRNAGKPMPAAFVAVYPAMHPNGRHPDRLFEPGDPMENVPLNYAGSTTALRDPVAFPGMGSLRGFPPSFVVVCENDFLRPSVEKFVTQLDDAGVSVVRWFEPDAAHGHLNDPSHRGAARTLAAIADWLRADSGRQFPHEVDEPARRS